MLSFPKKNPGARARVEEYGFRLGSGESTSIFLGLANAGPRTTSEILTRDPEPRPKS